jgi:hypothetical protein
MAGKRQGQKRAEPGGGDLANGNKDQVGAGGAWWNAAQLAREAFASRQWEDGRAGRECEGMRCKRFRARAVLWVVLTAMLPTVVISWAAAVPLSDIISGISESSYRHFLYDVLYTHDGDNRGFGPEHDLARGAIYNTFTGYGLTTSLHPFTYGGNTYYNVVGILPGTETPEKWMVLGAHYDSVSNPGADDDASGVAALLESARVLSQYEFRSSIVFVAFDREEQGLIGSIAFCNTYDLQAILGMVQLDMIAYNPAGPYENLVSVYSGRRLLYPEWRHEVAVAVNNFARGLTANEHTATGTAASDHQSFEDHWKPAALVIEDTIFRPESNPYYHTARDSVDTPGYLDLTYATEITRAMAGLAANTAGMVPEPETVALVVLGLAVLLAMRWRLALRVG